LFGFFGDTSSNSAGTPLKYAMANFSISFSSSTSLSFAPMTASRQPVIIISGSSEVNLGPSVISIRVVYPGSGAFCFM
jgi:hypothetical protein